MKKIIFMLTLGLMLAACNNKKSNSCENPFLCRYDTPFGVPPFNEIKPAHFLPALDEGIKQQNAVIDSIINNKALPDFENTVVAFEFSSELFERVYLTFENLRSCDATDSLDAISEDIVKKVSKHSDDISLNSDLFGKIKQVYEKRDELALNREQLMLLERTYKDFVRSGANLSEEQKAEIRQINERLSLLELEFETKVRNETNAFQLVVDRIEDCDGVPQSLIDVASETAKANGIDGKYVFTLDRASIFPFLQTAKNRDLREKIFKGYIMRCDNGNADDTKQNIAEQVVLRTRKAQIFGYKNYAEYALENKMAKTPEAAIRLLMQIWEPALQLAKQEAGDIQKMITESGEKFKIEPWDWNYYAEKIRVAKYDLNEEMLLPYFSLDNVLQGVFDVALKLYGLQFIKHNDIPVYHDDVVAYEVQEADGKQAGILYLDFYVRPTKGVGAWMTEFRTQHRICVKDEKTSEGKTVDVRPVVSLVYNFARPAADKPTLLSLDDVSTVFHEFGHALNGLLSDCTYPSVAGTNTPTDFVELPSQIMENWALLPEVLNMYASHYETGESIPKELTDKITESKKFNQGFNNVELLAASLLDMAYHTRSATEPIADINKFERDEMQKIGLIPQIVPRYRSTYFKHIFSGGYTAGYYSYRWSAVLDADAFEAFVENGYFDKTTATSFRKNILERGYTDDLMKLYVDFRGHSPNVYPLLKREGLKE
ncbi:MAG: M3 family metallopeptidase [Prevotellaceae bacterium]|jgi:peptidyl-dipeptidase Dcp|nr:M3 family metallopeptidase [Prevotellaceae bacterium]